MTKDARSFEEFLVAPAVVELGDLSEVVNVEEYRRRWSEQVEFLVRRRQTRAKLEVAMAEGAANRAALDRLWREGKRAPGARFGDLFHVAVARAAWHLLS